MNSLLLRADASHEVGAGHLMRMVALAEQHQARGGKAWLVLGPDAGELADLARRRGLRVITHCAEVGSFEDARQVLLLASFLDCHACVIDGYRFSSEYVQRVRERGFGVVAIDDLDRDLGADRVIRPLPEDSPVVPHGASCGASGDLRGSDYALLRREFLAHPRGPRPDASDPLRLLVCFGASDPTGSAARVVRCLPDSPAVRATVLVGAGYRDDGTLEDAALDAAYRGHVVVLGRDVPDVAWLMAQADAAVCAAGSVLLELAYFGCPTLALVVAENQLPGAQALVRAGRVLSGARIHDLSDSDLTALLSALVDNKALRRQLSARFGALVDGRGAARVLHAVHSLLEEKAA